MGLVVPNFDSSRELLVICVTPGIAKNADWEIQGKIVAFGPNRGFPLKLARDRAEPFESGFPRRPDLPPSSIAETARIIFRLRREERQRSGCPPALHRFLGRGFPSPRARQSLLSRDSSCSRRLSGSVRARCWRRIFCRTGTATLAISACSGRRSLPTW